MISHYNDYEWLISVGGHRWHSPKGETLWRAEDLDVDRTYEQHYHFTRCLVKLRQVENPERTKNVQIDEFKRDWVDIDAT